MEKGTQTKDPIKDLEKQLNDQKQVLEELTLTINNIVKVDLAETSRRSDLSNQMVQVHTSMKDLERQIRKVEIEQNILKNKVKSEEPKKKIL